MQLYDAVIIGSGPAGLACSICLGKNGVTNLVLEQKAGLFTKTCGDGLTNNALNLLDELGIDILSANGKKVYSKVIYKAGSITEYKFKDLYGDEFEYGIHRDILRDLLLASAKEHGATVISGHKCTSIIRQNDSYLIDDMYQAKNVIVACGAPGIPGITPARPSDLPMGMSARIKGHCDYSDSSFHYFFDERYDEGYAWLFPIGDGLWNLGVYGCDPHKIKHLYYEHEKNIFGCSGFSYINIPKAAFVGATNQEHPAFSGLRFIGDCAYSSFYSSGEGISYALEDGINTARGILNGNE